MFSEKSRLTLMYIYWSQNNNLFSEEKNCCENVTIIKCMIFCFSRLKMAQKAWGNIGENEEPTAVANVQCSWWQKEDHGVYRLLNTFS